MAQADDASLAGSYKPTGIIINRLGLAAILFIVAIIAATLQECSK